MYKFEDITRAKISGNKTKLFESSMGRIWQHVVNSNEKSIAILTSWRVSNTKKQNQSDFASLKSSVRGLGLGFVQMKGHWRECQDDTISYEDCPEENLISSIEPSLFIIGITMEDASKLSAKYKQDAFVYSGPETEGRVELVFNNGETMDIGTFNPQTLGQAYTELLNSREDSPRYFKFEGIEYPAQSWVEKIIEQEIKKVLK